MNNIADDLVYAIICELAEPGTEFHIHDLRILLELDRRELVIELHRLRDEGVIRFTGRICRWQRVR